MTDGVLGDISPDSSSLEWMMLKILRYVATCLYRYYVQLRLMDDEATDGVRVSNGSIWYG